MIIQVYTEPTPVRITGFRFVVSGINDFVDYSDTPGDDRDKRSTFDYLPREAGSKIYEISILVHELQKNNI